MREYFCAYHSMLDATRKLSEAECGRLFRSLLAYSQGRTELINLQGREEIVFDIYSQQIDREIERYEQTCERNRANVTSRYQSLPVVTSRYDPIQGKGEDKDKDKGEDKDKGKSKREREPRARTRFRPPDQGEVEAYAREMKWTPEQFNAERFVNYYGSKGWKVGRDTMTDWKAAARGWVARDNAPKAPEPARENPALDYAQREYKAEDYGDDYYFDVVGAYGGKA